MNIETINLLNVLDNHAKSVFNTNIITLNDLKETYLEMNNHEIYLLQTLFSKFLKTSSENLDIESEIKIAENIVSLLMSQNIFSKEPIYEKIFDIALLEYLHDLTSNGSNQEAFQFGTKLVNFLKNNCIPANNSGLSGMDFGLWEKIENYNNSLQYELHNKDITQERKHYIDETNDILQKIKYDIIDLQFKFKLKNLNIFSDNDIKNLNISDIDKITYLKKISDDMTYNNNIKYPLEEYKKNLNLKSDYHNLYNDNIFTNSVEEDSYILSCNLISNDAKRLKNTFVHVVKAMYTNIPFTNCLIFEDQTQFTISLKIMSEKSKHEEIHIFDKFMNQLIDVIKEDRIGYYSFSEIDQWTIHFNQELSDFYLTSKRELDLLSTLEIQNKNYHRPKKKF